jgi:two-component system NtrC family sensor kinase
MPLTAADPHQLQQVFLNLVNNAVDAVLEGSSDGDLWVRTGVRANSLSVEFTDSGPGVREPSRVFDPFYTTKPVGKGTGLGLSICYGIVTEHGGTIHVRNVPPHGASFVIELPFQKAGKAPELHAGGLAAPARPGRILLIDRDQSVLEAVGAILRGRDHTVRAATGLQDAQLVLQEQEFDVVVADMQVCGTAEMGLHAWLAANRPELAMRVIEMIATAPLSEPLPGVLQVLQKPFKAGDLLAAVEAALSDVHTVAVER